MFSCKSGIPNYGPRILLTGSPIDVKLHCHVSFGTYYQINEEPDPSNTNTPRTTGAISINSQGNLQGGYNFLTLNIWKVFQCRKFISLHMPHECIITVERHARKQQVIDK